jgi:hypothetical protein
LGVGGFVGPIRVLLEVCDVLQHVASSLEGHAVIGWRYVWGQLFAQRLVIKINVHVGDDGLLRLHAHDPFERLSQREMTGVRFVAQRVDDPDIETFEVL